MIDVAAMAFERVFTVPDWWDGPRSGMALFCGAPHYFESTFTDDEAEGDVFLLCPVTDDELQLALEAWGIWRRWGQAFGAGTTTIETHPALPMDRARRDELEGLLQAKGLTPRGVRHDRPVVRARATFMASGEDNGHASLLVKWRPVDDVPDPEP